MNCSILLNGAMESAVMKRRREEGNAYEYFAYGGRND